MISRADPSPTPGSTSPGCGSVDPRPRRARTREHGLLQTVASRIQARRLPHAGEEQFPENSCSPALGTAFFRKTRVPGSEKSFSLEISRSPVRGRAFLRKSRGPRPGEEHFSGKVLVPGSGKAISPAPRLRRGRERPGPRARSVHECCRRSWPWAPGCRDPRRESRPRARPGHEGRQLPAPWASRRADRRRGPWPRATRPHG